MSNIKFNKKKKKGSNRIEPCNHLIHDYNLNKSNNYLNVSFKIYYIHAGMAEWLMQSFDTRRHSWLGGSIPSAGVISISQTPKKSQEVIF